MPYESNPYNSTKGREMVRQIFHNLFLNDGTTMKLDTAQENVAYFRGKNGARLHQTVSIMKNFIRSFRQKPYQTSLNSGILICPHCNRRDYMWLWEFVDFGLRNQNYDWTSSVEPDKNSWEVGFNRRTPKDRKSGWRFMSRVRCNKVTTCNACKITTTGTFSTCRKCSSSDVAHAGCHHESYMVHVVEEVQAASWLADATTYHSRGIQNEKYVSVYAELGGGVAKSTIVKPFMYRVRNPGPAPAGLVIDNSMDAFKYIPQLEVGYQDTLDGGRRPYGYKCPKCRFMRYTPLHDEDFAAPIDSRPPPSCRFDDESFSSKGDKNISTGAIPTINKYPKGEEQEQQGGLVDNMGHCPNPDCDNIKLVPSLSVKAPLPPAGFMPSGNPWNPRKRMGSSAAWVSGVGRGGVYGAGLVMDYISRQVNRFDNARPAKYPFSPIHAAFSRSEKEACLKCDPDATGAYGGFWDLNTGTTLNCITPGCGEWQPKYRSLVYKIGSRNPVMNPPQMMRIISPQPLVPAKVVVTASGPAMDWGDEIGSKRVSGNTADESASKIWAVRIDCPLNPADSVLQEQAQLFSLMKIPNLPTTPTQTGMGITMCPNDVEGKAYGDWKRKHILKKTKDIDWKDDEWLKSKLVNLDGDAPDDGTLSSSDGTNMKDYFKTLQDEGEIPNYLNVGSTIQIISPNRDAEFQTITSYDLLKYRPSDAETDLYGRRWQAQVRTENILLPPGEDSYYGVTSPGYTFVVCEGRSKEAFIDINTNEWVDVSPECASYHNRLAPEVPLDSLFYHPRWTQTPDNDIRPPKPGNITGEILGNDGDYYWNSTNHFVQDQYQVDNFLASFMGTGANGTPCLEKKFHDFHTLDEPMYVNDSLIVVFECKTCKKVWELGEELTTEGKYTPGAAVKQYYINKRMLDEDGKTTDEEELPQECIDAAIKKEQDMISNWGIEDNLLQNMGRGGSTEDTPITAKQMLETARITVSED